MKLVMTLLVRDEEDIVADNLDFHLAQGVDEVIVTDNGSSDATLEILRDYEARGVVRHHRGAHRRLLPGPLGDPDGADGRHRAQAPTG